MSDSLDSLAERDAQSREILRLREELARLDRELEETNRGVVALYAELEAKAAEEQAAREAAE